jgi:hypothetical protein
MFGVVAVGLALVAALVVWLRRRRSPLHPTARHAQPVTESPTHPSTRRAEPGAHAAPPPAGPDDDAEFIAQLAASIRLRRSDPDAQ